MQSQSAQPHLSNYTAARVGDDTLLRNPNHRGAEWASGEEASDEEEKPTTSHAATTKLDRFGNEVPIDPEEQEELDGVEGLVSAFEEHVAVK